MTVLRILNNGAWEDLNIDHASSADSAVRDGNGDVISDTYLPLTAGSTKPLSDDLYIDCESNDASRLYFTNQGTPTGVLYSHNNYGYTVIANKDSNGTNVSGTRYLNDGSITMFGTSGNIRLRPNGADSTTGQVYFDTSGQQHGGHSCSIVETTSTISMTADTAKAILNFYAPANSVYLMHGVVRFTASASTGANRRIGFSSQPAVISIASNSCYVPSSAAMEYSITAFWYETGGYSVYLNFYPGYATGGTVNYAMIRYVRLA